MNLFHNIMDKLGRYRLIPDRRTGADYMHRYYVFLKDRKKFPFNVTLHKIVRSDDPIFHDHPWPYMTIVLRGGYWEHTPVFDEKGKLISENRVFKGPGSIVHRKSKEYHWLELDNEKPAMTLFFMGPQQREWGFLVELKRGVTRWVKWTHYLEDWKNYHETKVMSKTIKALDEKKL